MPNQKKYCFDWVAPNGINKELIKHCAGLKAAKKHARIISDKDRADVEVYQYDEENQEYEHVGTVEKRGGEWNGQ